MKQEGCGEERPARKYETEGVRGGTPRQKGSNLYSVYFPASQVTRPPSRGPRILVNLFSHISSNYPFEIGFLTTIYSIGHHPDYQRE